MMEFPNYTRVKYRKNPLEEVLFQFRIPRDLEIEQQLPVSLQKSLRNDFPKLTTRTERTISIAADSQEKPVVSNGPTIYDFTSADDAWTFSLSSNFFALSCKRYEQWEDFERQSEKVIREMLSTYDLSHFTRIGLRYRSVISKEDLGLEQSPWSELLSPRIASVLGEMSTAEIESASLLESNAEHLFRIDPGKLSLRHGLALNTETKKVGYIIDADYYGDEEIEATLDAGIKKLKDFHGYAWRVFRWCIEGKLHDAMEPEHI